MVRAIRIAVLLGLLGVLIAFSQRNPDYQTQIQPILAKNCYACHSAERAMGGIRLDGKLGVFGTGDSGNKTIVPGNSAGSELIRRVTAPDRNVRMPLAGEALPAEQIQLLRAWVDAGASWPETPGAKPADAKKPGEMIVSQRDRQHWAFLPLQPARLPPVRNTSWVRTPIDRYILAALEAKGLKPAPETSKEQLIRRASFALTGLPPTTGEIEAFRDDRSAKAYETVVERLLASPHFGERWGRHWLDAARYADSEGYNRDRDRPLMYRYRDFVIRAMNGDMPFNRFVRWQLAGDEYEPDNPEAVTATGFLAAGPSEEITITDTDENKQKYYYDELDDFVSTTSLSMLGLTVGCARCHDHKFDPIPTRDYYRLVATFRNVDRRETFLSLAHRELERWQDAKHLAFRVEKVRAAGIPEEVQYLLVAPLATNVSGQVFFYKQYGDRIKYTEDDFQAWLTPQDRATQARLKGEVAEAEKRLNGGPLKASIVDDKRAEPEESFLLGRGSVTDKKEKIGFGFLSVLTRGREPEQYRTAVARQGFPSSFQRSALAEWLVDPEHGAGHLVARVIVNRLWQHYFGEGLVRTTSDFGLQGDKPSHPELLDYLAGELIRSSWRLKTIHRMIATSAVYRLSTRYDETAAKVDPDNRLLSRRRPQRLEGEVLRDSILAVSGSLNSQMFGPGVRPPIPAEATLTRSRDKWPKDAVDGPETWRRSIYIFNKRAIRYPWLETFDAPDGILSCGRRVPTTVPTQSLALMNDSFVRQQANIFAARLVAQFPGGLKEKVERAYQSALGRRPSATELDHSLTFLNAPDGGGETERLADFCHTLITLNEFFYVD